MRNLNQVLLEGNIGNMYTFTGNQPLRFSLAVNESYKKDDEWIQRTNWINVVVWGNMREIVEQNYSVGDTVRVTGRLQTGSYENKEGATVRTVDVILSQIDRLQRANSSSDSEDTQEADADLFALDDTNPPF